MAERLDPEPERDEQAQSKEAHGEEVRLDAASYGQSHGQSPSQIPSDPLDDRHLEAASSTRPSVQAMVFGLLALIFAYFLVSDLAHRQWGKAALGAVVVAICAFAVKRELDRAEHG